MRSTFSKTFTVDPSGRVTRFEAPGYYLLRARYPMSIRGVAVRIGGERRRR